MSTTTIALVAQDMVACCIEKVCVVNNLITVT